MLICVSGICVSILNRNDGVLEEGLEEEAQCPRHTHDHEDPQEEPVHHHGHVLPVLDHLQQTGEAESAHWSLHM